MCGILGLVMVLGLLLTSCTDDIVEGGMGRDEDASVKGQMILFAAGTTENAMGTRAEGNGGVSVAPGKTYYMPQDYRFVCRMYYKASTDANAKFDVEGGSDITVWMKVKGDKGNSLYWRKNYQTLDEGNSGLFDTFGNDKEATCLYWQNRMDHAFLAWTDLNKATTNTYSPVKNSGALKFEPADLDYVKHTGIKEDQWVMAGYEVYAVGLDKNPEFTTWTDLQSYLETDNNYSNNIANKYPDGISADDYTEATYYYMNGKSCKFSMKKASYESVDNTHRKFGWIQYKIFGSKLTYQVPEPGENIEKIKDSNGTPVYLYDKVNHKYLAKIEYDANNTPSYYQTDEYGNVLYDEANPQYVFYVKRLEEKKEQEKLILLPANAFDLTHNATFNRISDQPDVCRALTIQKPEGATQNANRVNLYFKHQFSQVQVNIKSSDASVAIAKENIQKVELLGVSEKAYVFTGIDEDGNVEPTTYEPVDISKYDDAHLTNNPFGTSFEMFDMGYGNADYEYPTGYAKAFNAITFGQLRAIRVTWKESETDIVHVSTYRVEDQTLQNLQSGYKYIWNIELRRGTLAIVRTEIVDWIVPIGELEYKGDGKIDKTNN